MSETSAPSDENPRVQWKRSGAGSADTLIIFKQPRFTPEIALQFGAYGAWQQDESLAGGSTRVRLDYFTYGTATPAAAVPPSGVATYRWRGTGIYAEDQGLFATQSSGFATQASGTFSIDFAARTFEVRIDISGTDSFTGSSGGLISFVARGTLTGGTFGGPLEFTLPTYGGTLRGTLYGPNAEAIGVVYSGSGDRVSFNGAFMGVRN
jgi:hypothetical protein